MGNVASLCSVPPDEKSIADNDERKAKIRNAFTRCESVLSLYDQEEREGKREVVEELHTAMTSIHKAVRVVNKLSSELDIEKAMANVRAVALELMDCERVTLFLVDEARKELRAKPAPGSNEPILRVMFGEGIAGTVAQSGKPMNIPDVYKCPSFNKKIDEMTGFRTRNMLCWPVTNASGKHIAVLQALNKKAGHFTWVEENALELFVVHIGNTLAKSRLHEKALREQQKMAAMGQWFKSLNTARGLDEVIQTISKAVKELVGAELVFLFLMDTAREELWTNFRCPDHPPKLTTIRTKLDGNLLGRCATTKSCICTHKVPCDDTTMETLRSCGGFAEYKSVLLHPLIGSAKKECLGVIVAVNKVIPSEAHIFFEDQYSEADRDAISVLSHEVEEVIDQFALEVSFASALSTVSETGYHANSTDTREVLHAQLAEYCAQGEEYMNIYRSCSSAYPQNLALSHLTPRSLRRRILSDGSREVTSERKTKARRRSELGPTGMMKRWDLDFIELPTNELIKLAFDIFVDAGVMAPFNIKDTVLMAFLAAVASHYQANPYHAFLHAVYVLHGVWMILTTTSVGDHLLPQDQLALLVAAICHDVDHDGKTNQFHINSESVLAQRYNDISVMENHHCAIAFAILAKAECAILDGIDRGTQKDVRKMIIAAIMATDMGQHFTLASEFQRCARFDIADEASRTFLCKAVLHCADISNPVRSFEVAFQMSQRVQDEFKLQAEEERSLGLPVAPHMDIKTEAMQYQAEANFTDYIAMPMWQRAAQLFQPLEICVAQMKRNRDQFMNLAECAKMQETIAEKSSSDQPEEPAHPSNTTRRGPADGTDVENIDVDIA